MSEFKAKMHQVRFPLGLRPNVQTPLQRSPAGFKGPMEREGKEGGGEEKEKRGRGNFAFS